MPAKPPDAMASKSAERGFSMASLSVFEFNADDLSANQRGHLTEKQRGWLRSTARGIRGCSMASAPIALAFVLLGLVLILAMFLQNEDSRAALFSSPINLLILAAVAVMAVAAVGLSIVLARRQAGLIEQAQLQAAQGRIRLAQDFSPRSGITNHHVYVGDHKFTFADDMSSVFGEGQTFRVYYCKSGPYQLIMSFERLPA